MKLRLSKVEECVCAGKVLWHEFVTKTNEEEKAIDALWEQRNQEKAERRRIQRENVEKKRKEKAANDEEVEEDGNLEDLERNHEVETEEIAHGGDGTDESDDEMRDEDG